jgi:hypothetical protein
MYKKKTAVRHRQGQKEVSAEGDSESRFASSSPKQWKAEAKKKNHRTTS